MFDIGPSELLVIFVVALLVIGPERLPSAVKTASLWIGRFRRSFHKIKAEVERELNADEIRRQIHNESIMAEVEDAKKKVKEITGDITAVGNEIANGEVAKADQTTGQTADATADESLAVDTPEPSPTDDARLKTTDPARPQTTDDTRPETASKDATTGSEPTVADEVKQALSYVNDISREVEASKAELEEQLKYPGSVNKSRSGNKT